MNKNDDLEKAKVYVPPAKHRQQARNEIDEELDLYYEERDRWQATDTQTSDEGRQ